MKRFLAVALLPAAFAPAAYAEPVNLASPGLVPVTVTDPGASIAGVEPERAGIHEGAVIAHYDKGKLMRAGALHEDTTRLVASDGSVEPVEPNVVLEVKLTKRATEAKVSSVAGPGELDPLVVGVDLDRLEARALAQSGKPLPDLAAWHQLTLPAPTPTRRSRTCSRPARSRTPTSPRTPRRRRSRPTRRRTSRPCRATSGRRRPASTPAVPEGGVTSC